AFLSRHDPRVAASPEQGPDGGVEPFAERPRLAPSLGRVAHRGNRDRGPEPNPRGLPPAELPRPEDGARHDRRARSQPHPAPARPPPPRPPERAGPPLRLRARLRYTPPAPPRERARRGPHRSRGDPGCRAEPGSRRATRRSWPRYASETARPWP